MNILQKVKRWLIGRGCGDLCTQIALILYGIRHGCRVQFDDERIRLVKLQKTMLISFGEFISVPMLIKLFDYYFDLFDSDTCVVKVLDFSRPGKHKYSMSGITLWTPAVGEDDSIDMYTKYFTPGPGMCVFDVGAHAGLTTVQLSSLVGENGHVFAFEPDDVARYFLNKNVELHDLKNVTIFPYALGECSGQALFNMNSTMSAGLVGSMEYSEYGKSRLVEVISFQDACIKAGCVPQFVKADIEGAEVGLIRGALDFIKRNDIQFAFESYHMQCNGVYSYVDLDKLYNLIGYEVISSPDSSGVMFTWAWPK